MRRKIRKIVKSPGLFVVVLGIDGSGKTTVIEHLRPASEGAFAGTHYIHFRPRLGVSEEAKASVVVNPHDQTPRNWFVCVLKMAYFLFDYTAGYIAKVLPALARNKLVIFDRYYHDLLVDPHRYRYGGPMWLARWVGNLIPKPDLWILLDAPPHVLRARKQEVALGEMIRHQEIYLGLAEKLRKFRVVDASPPLDDVMADVNKIIVSHLAERTGRRLGL